MAFERKQSTKAQKFDHTITDREFFYKVSSPEKIREYYLNPLEMARGFVDKFQYLTPQDILFMLSDYINRHQNTIGCNINNIVFINDIPTFSQLAKLLEQKELKNNEDLKIVLKLRPNQKFSSMNQVWPNVPAPVFSSQTTMGIHTTLVYVRNENNVLKVFLSDAGGGVFFDFKDGFTLLTDVLTSIGLKKYSDVRIIKCTAATQNSWRDCPIYMLDGLDLLCRQGNTLFSDIEKHLVASQHKIVDKHNSYIFHLKIDHTPAKLLRMSSLEHVDQLHVSYKLPTTYFDKPNFIAVNGHQIVKQKPRTTLTDYYDKNIEKVYVDKVYKYSYHRVPNDKFMKKRIEINKFMRERGILNARNEFNSASYNHFIRECLNSHLTTPETAKLIQFDSAVEELILGKQYALSEKHYSGYEPHAVDYSVIMKTPTFLSDKFKAGRLYQSMMPVKYTKEYRDKYFSLNYAINHSSETKCAPGCTVLWSGGYIQSHPNYYGLGRISAEAGLTYLNELIVDKDEKSIEDKHTFSTVAMTETGMPVLNPMWEDSETPFTTKCQITPYYITSFARNASGHVINLNVDDSDCDSFFRQNELAIVMNNSSIKKVRTFRLDLRTNLPIYKTLSKSEWYEEQKNQWITSIIVRLELVLAEWDRLENVEEKSDHLVPAKKRLVNALIDEVKEILSNGNSLSNLRRLTEVTSYYYKRKDIFKANLSEKEIRQIKIAKLKYNALLVSSLVKSKSELSFNQNYWLEMIDANHRSHKYHLNLFKKWSTSTSQLNYFTWVNQVHPESKYEERIHYYSLEDQQRLVITISEDGKLWRNGKLFSTEGYLGKIHEYGMFVLIKKDETQKTSYHFIIDEYVMKYLHHTSLSRGKRVPAGGMIRVVEGKITHISFVSGHNRPDYNAIDLFLNTLPDSALKDVTMVTSYDAWSGSLGDKAIWEEKQFDVSKLQQIITHRESRSKIKLNLKLSAEHHAEEKLEQVPREEKITPFNIPMIEHEKSILRHYPKTDRYEQLLASIYRNSRRSLDQLLFMAKRSRQDLKKIAFNSMQWERKLLHTVIATLMVKIKPFAITQELVDHFYKFVFDNLNKDRISELSQSVRIEIDRFLEVYSILGIEKVKNFKFYNEFHVLLKQFNSSFDLDHEIAKEILFDKYFSEALNELFINQVNEKFDIYFKNRQNDILTLHSLADRQSHEVLGGIATGKSTLVEHLLKEAKHDVAFINTDVISNFLRLPIGKPFDYLSFQCCYDEILLVKLIINAQFEILANTQKQLPNCILESIYSQPHLKHLMLAEGGKLIIHIQTARDPLATVQRAFDRSKVDKRYMASSVVLFTQKEGAAQLAEEKLEYHASPVELLGKLNPQITIEICEKSQLIASCTHQQLTIYDLQAWNNYLKNIHINYHAVDESKLYPADVDHRISTSKQLIQQLVDKQGIKLVIKESSYVQNNFFTLPSHISDESLVAKEGLTHGSLTR